MLDNQFTQNIQEIQQKIEFLHSYMSQLLPQQKEMAEVWQEMTASLNNLQLVYEEMQTGLESAKVVEEELLQQNHQAVVDYYNYYDLFEFSPIAYLVTDARGIILEANRAIALLLNVPQNFLVGKPLAVFIAEAERQAFYTYLDKLSQSGEVQTWEMSLCPRKRQPFKAQLHVASLCNDSGSIQALRIGIYNLSQYQQTLEPTQPLNQQSQITASVPTLPQSLDGLQVLFVDDEADTREYISAVLESHGIRVTAVGSAAAALEALARFRPDVLVSDIRLPDEDGYALIRQVRELEAERGWQIPAAALTAYLEESWENSLSAGFEAHLHKLAQPIELIEMVARLAERAPS